MTRYLLDRQAAMLKALGHPVRLRIVELLSGWPAGGGERCVCEIIPALGLDQSAVSKHLAVLRGHGVLNARRDGSRVLYSLAGPGIAEMARLARELCLERMAEAGREISALRGAADGEH